MTNASAGAAVQFEGVSFRYEPQGDWVLRGVDLRIEKGGFVAIIGQNGAGKTTLAKHINGILSPTEGQVLVNGTSTKGRRGASLALTVGYCYQNPDHQIFSATVGTEVAFGPVAMGLPPAEVESRVVEALALVDLTTKRQVHPSLLGRGERQRLAVAGVLAVGAEILVVDEPTTGLDYQGISRIMGLLTDWNERLGRTIIVITHDIRTVADFVPQTVIMGGGHVLFSGRTAAAFQQDDILRAAAVVPPQVVRVAKALGFTASGDLLTVAQLTEAFRHPKTAASRTAMPG